jgi:hypothetical protein
VPKRSHIIVLFLLGLPGSSLACSSQSIEATGRSAQAQISALPQVSPTPTPSPLKPVQAQQIDKTWSSRYKFGTTSISEKHDGIRSYEISVDIPRIKQARTPATRRFNLWIKKKILGDVAEFRHLQRFAEISDKRKKLPPLPISESLELSYRVYYSDERLISLRLTHTVMAIGQMHPIDYYETINYDLRTGRLLRPADIFKTGYLKSLSAYCRDELSKSYDLSNESFVNEGTSPKGSNFHSWNIVPEGILLSFADYQVASHSFGKPEMIIPYSALARVMKRTDLINKLNR